MKQKNTTKNIIVRHEPPGEYDQLPIGTICKINYVSGKYEFYIQTNSDDAHPKWELYDHPYSQDKLSSD